MTLRTAVTFRLLTPQMKTTGAAASATRGAGFSRRQRSVVTSSGWRSRPRGLIREWEKEPGLSNVTPHRKTHVNEILVEAFPQVVQEGTLARVGVQENKVLDAHAIPGCQGGLHVPQDLVTPHLQALYPSRNTSATHDRGTRYHNRNRTVLCTWWCNLFIYWNLQILCYLWPSSHSFRQDQAHMSHPFPVFLKSYLFLLRLSPLKTSTSTHTCSQSWTI